MTTHEDLVPGEGFLRLYLEYAGQLTHAPDCYHLGVGWGIQATALGNRVGLTFGDWSVLPNVWILKIGPTSFAKSTADGIGVRLLRSCGIGHLYPQDVTPEALVDELSEHPDGLMLFSELREAGDSWSKEYNTGSKSKLTHFFEDGLPYRRRNRAENIEVPAERAITILASSTPEWLIGMMSEADLRGGFWNRWLYIATPDRKPYLHIPSKPDARLKEELQEHLRKSSKLEGEFRLAEGAKKLHRHIGESFDLKARDTSDDLHNLMSRLGTPYALKLAMLYEVSMNPMSRVVSEKAMWYASEAVCWVEETVRKLFDEELIFDPISRERTLVKRIIFNESGISRSDLLRKVCKKMCAKELDRHLATLFQTKEILKTVEGFGRRETIFYHTWSDVLAEQLDQEEEL